MMVRVVWSRATLAPTVSLDRSILALTPTTFLGPLEDLMISGFKSDGTFLFVELLEDLTNNLTYGLQRFELVVGFGDLFFLVSQLKSF